MAVSITISNLALGELRASPIVDIAEDTIEARECARYYPQCLKVLLERHDWSFANQRATLALLSDNPRPNEWTYAYAMPSGVAKPLSIISGGVTGGQYYHWRSCPTWWADFDIEAGILYSQIEGATLEYSANDVSEAVMSALFVDALVYALASRLAVPIINSTLVKGQLINQSELAFQRAVAEDRNRQPQREVQPLDEVAMVRAGGVC